MLGLTVTFHELLNVFIFLILVAFNIRWFYYSLGKKSHLNWKPFIICNIVLFFIWGRLVSIDVDETEHLHCAWMVSQGLVPFKDFWQHHSPLLWIVLAPVFKVLKPTVLIFEMSRIFCALIFLAIAFVGWQIAKKIFQEKASFSVYLLILSSASILGQFVWLRTDLFMVLFSLIGIFFFLEMERAKPAPYFFAGVSFALAFSFTIKQNLLFLLPFITIFLKKDTRKPPFGLLLVYIAGLIFGSLPLLIYLIKNNILGEFFLWVFGFNSKIVTLSTIFPVAIGFMGAWGAYLLFKRYRKLKDTKALILLTAFCLVTLNSLTVSIYFLGASYYSGLWFVLCAILGSGCDIARIIEKLPSLKKKAAMLGIFVTLLSFYNFTDGIVAANNYFLKRRYFSGDKKIISKLMGYCVGDSCLVFLPRNPVFARDATRLYSYWQYWFMRKFYVVEEDIKKKDIADQLIRLRPAVITYKCLGRDLFLDLLGQKIITQEDYNKIKSLLEETYTLTDIEDNEYYYIRNDKI